MAKRIACVVEGFGDCEAVPIVVRRVAEQIVPRVVVQVVAPVRVPKSRLVKPTELERAVEYAARRIAGRGGVLVLLDSDDDCPAVIGPQLLARARAVRAAMPVAVVLAKREFECWLIAAAESLAGYAGLRNDLQAPVDPESIRGAKEWLTERMSGSGSYSPTLHQPALALRFDLGMARRSDSFDKLSRVVEQLVLAAPDAW